MPHSQLEAADVPAINSSCPVPELLCAYSVAAKHGVHGVV